MVISSPLYDLFMLHLSIPPLRNTFGTPATPPHLTHKPTPFRTPNIPPSPSPHLSQNLERMNIVIPDSRQRVFIPGRETRDGTAGTGLGFWGCDEWDGGEEGVADGEEGLV